MYGREYSIPGSPSYSLLPYGQWILQPEIFIPDLTPIQIAFQRTPFIFICLVGTAILVGRISVVIKAGTPLQAQIPRPAA
jgi:hypothetical protein